MQEIGFTLPSFAKINWFLRIIGKRDDGYHELSTVFQTISLHDEVHFAEHRELVLTCSDSSVPAGRENLIIRAGNALRDKFEIKKGARIHLEKRIPFPGGLGGGSSNAAIALIGLAKLWKLELRVNELVPIAKALGSDVPFFLFGGTAFGGGRGTEIEMREDLVENHLLIVTPEVFVPTSKAFELLDMPYLTNIDSKSILQICRSEALELNLRQLELKNDFENAVFKVEPEIERVKKKLFDLKAEHALMSGSGPSVFAGFQSEEKRVNALEALKTEGTWRVYPVKTVSRREYLKLLNL